MKKFNGSIIARIAVIAASSAAAAAILLKIKKNNDILTSYENEDDDAPDFGEIDSLDSINPDKTERRYVSINITDNKTEE